MLSDLTQFQIFSVSMANEVKMQRVVERKKCKMMAKRRTKKEAMRAALLHWITIVLKVRYSLSLSLLSSSASMRCQLLKNINKKGDLKFKKKDEISVIFTIELS